MLGSRKIRTNVKPNVGAARGGAIDCRDRVNEARTLLKYAVRERSGRCDGGARGRHQPTLDCIRR